MRASAKISIAVLLVAAFVAGIFFATGTDVFDIAGSEANNHVPQEVDALPALEINDTDDLSNAYNRVAETVTPSVVQIVTQRQRQQGQRRNPFEGTPFEDFFDVPERQQEMPPQTGLGSGVVVRSDGYIVTNYHVVEGASEVEVHMADGTTHDGEIVGSDPSSDLAVIQVDASGLPRMPFASRDDIRVGNWVVAVGSPFSERLGNSVTTGIISATGRSGFGGLSPGDGQFAPVQDFIQTDAAINPGNSGGALVDLRGRLVGINSAIISRTGSFAGIGFAIPIDIVQNAVQQIIDQGYVSRGFLGIRYQPISTALAQAMDVTRGAVQIAGLEDGGPAAEAGLQQGDVIVALDGNTLQNPAQLATIVAGKQPGEELEVTFVRDEERQTVTVELGERPNGQEQAQQAQQPDDEGAQPGATAVEGLGIEIADLSGQLRQRLGLSSDVQGIVITDVDPSSMAYDDAELRNPPYILTNVAGQNIGSVQEFQEVYGEVEAGDYFQIQVLTQGPDGTTASFRTALRKPE